MNKGYGVATLVSQTLTGDSALVSSRLTGDISSISPRLQGSARLLTFKDRYLRLLDNVGRQLKDKYGKLLYASKK